MSILRFGGARSEFLPERDNTGRRTQAFVVRQPIIGGGDEHRFTFCARDRRVLGTRQPCGYGTDDTLSRTIRLVAEPVRSGILRAAKYSGPHHHRGDVCRACGYWLYPNPGYLE